MRIEIDCGDCGREYRVQKTQAGKTLRCKDCGATMKVPKLRAPKRRVPQKRVPKKRRPAPRSEDWDLDDDDWNTPSLPQRPSRTSRSPKKKRRKNRSSGGSGLQMSLFTWGLIGVFGLWVIVCIGATIDNGLGMMGATAMIVLALAMLLVGHIWAFAWRSQRARSAESCIGGSHSSPSTTSSPVGTK